MIKVVTYTFLFTLLLSLLSCNSKSTGKQDRPNFVILFADDLGYSDIGCYGGEIETPNLDKLAENGIRFTQFMNGSKCAPSRASLLTGLYPIEAGCMGPPEQMINGITIAELLKSGGYTTLMSGKWHAKEHPVLRGFDHYYGCVAGGSNYFRPSKKRKFMHDDKVIAPVTEENKDRFYVTDIYTDRAIHYLDNYIKDDNPFFLYVAYTAPHFPLQAWPEDIAKYRGKYMKGWDVLREERFARQQKMGLVKPHWVLSARDTAVPSWESFQRKDDADLTMAVYAAMVDRMDQNIGRIIDKLEEQDKLDNTIILFFSDNGATAEGEMWDGKNPRTKPDERDSQAKLGIEWANACNTPFRKFKRQTFNGGHFTPFIAHWPQGIKQKGSINFMPANIVDILPTFIELAGVTHPEGEKWTVPGGNDLKNEWTILPLSGKSMVQTLKKSEIVERDHFFGHFQGARMIMDDNWKLVSDGGDGTVRHLYNYEWELYDLEKDGTETNNLATQYPNMVDSLDAIYRAWIDSVHRLNGIKDHIWYQPHYSKEQVEIAGQMQNDVKLQKLLKERRSIGLKIVQELKGQKVKVKTGLGMDKEPMSYFGIVNEGWKYSNHNIKLKELYNQWDKNIQDSESYCTSKGEEYLKLWHLHERVRVNMPASDVR
ncbi:arylsulfatase [Bacteroidales bacterium]|nr:arylsulfatase [Bacteroidales bacterium]